MRVILTAAGDGTRWGDHLGLPKQLAPVDGEPILLRAIRLWGEWSDDVIVVADDPRILDAVADTPARVEAPRQDPAMMDMGRFSSSQHLWDDDGRTLVLFGDVFWDEAAVAKIARSRHRQWRWLARLDGSERTGKDRPEGFGVSFYPQAHAEFAEAIARTAALHRTGATDRSLGFECWRVMQGAEPVRHPHPFPDVGRCIEINDWTDDIDRPGEYDRLVLRRAEATEPARPHGVSVVVPMRGLDERRALLWEWVRARFAERHPDWQIVLGHDGRADGQPFCRSAAIIDGLRQADGGVVLITDADVWCDQFVAAVQAVADGADWCLPHGQYIRFTTEATDRILAGEDPAGLDLPGNWEEEPYAQRPGAVHAIRRDLALAVPPDQRFVGWGGEENAWGWALTALAGEPVRLDGRAWHLWHEPQPRQSRHVGNSANQALRQRYQRAASTWGTEAITQLVAEARGEADPAAQPGSRRRRPRRDGDPSTKRTWRHRQDGRTRTVNIGSAHDRRYEAHPDLWEQV